ncbi:MAG: NAD(P)H-binding protein [Solirubrobacteraceae bacterium]|jgi:nucleoside-diphosphate-sugar epimerase
MRIVIAGGHGQIGLRLARISAARGDEVVGLIRNPDHAADVSATGAVPVICDLERASSREVAEAVGVADVVVFAAGAGPGSGAARKLTMDRDGAIMMLRAAEAVSAQYVMISSVGAEAPPSGDDVFAVYLRAKAEADAAVMASDRPWVIVRPGRLTSEPGSGRVAIEQEPVRGEISRDDVAAVLAALIDDRSAAGRVLYVNSGELPIDQALRRATA